MKKTQPLKTLFHIICTLLAHEVPRIHIAQRNSWWELPVPPPCSGVFPQGFTVVCCWRHGTGQNDPVGHPLSPSSSGKRMSNCLVTVNTNKQGLFGLHFCLCFGWLVFFLVVVGWLFFYFVLLFCFFFFPMSNPFPKNYATAVPSNAGSFRLSTLPCFTPA